LGFQGTVYIKLDRRAPSCDYSGSSSTVFYDSNGNPNFAASTFVPTMWQLDNGAGTNIQAWTQGSFNRNNNGAFFPTGNQVVNPALLIPSPNLDPSVMEYV
ncbi:hypothetical protein, partial [Enterococcus faecium]|uniref:hypothetical protein n=2 Tax=Bacteria TaxID=2 RepID=UPI0034E98A84